MAKSVIARKSGDEYQDDWFWFQASRIFHQDTSIKNVGYEVEGLIGFDDVVVTYEKPNLDEFGDQIVADYYQVKYHVDYHGAFTAKSIIDPAFINAKSTSLLQRVRRMQQTFAPNGKGIRLILISPWTIHPDDVLSQLVDTDSGHIKIDRLFDGKRRSSFSEIRNLWAKHLKLNDEEELKLILRPFRINTEFASKKNFSLHLNNALIVSGLKPVDENSGNPYHSLIRRLHLAGNTVFTRKEIIQACKKSGLCIDCSKAPSGVKNIGIRSFLRWTEYLEDETVELLDLVPLFENRNIRDTSNWNGEILNRIKDFIKENIKTGNAYRIHLDAHSSICFAVGYYLDKAGANCILMQRTPTGYEHWEVGNIQPASYSNDWTFQNVAIGKGEDIAVAISVTHDISEDVKIYVQNNLPGVGKIVFAHLINTGSLSVNDGNHAFYLAQQLIKRIRSERPKKMENRLHLFFAGPNGLALIIGKNGKPIGNITLYEYDFEQSLPGAYTHSIDLPN